MIQRLAIASALILAAISSQAGVVGGINPFLLVPAASGGGAAPGTVLAGNDAIETNETLMNGGVVVAYTSAYTASATGVAATGHFYGRSESGANCKVLIYSSDGSSLLGTSAGLALSGSNAWNDFTFSAGPTINSGTGYVLGIICDTYFYLRWEGGSWSTTTGGGGSYASPPSSVTLSGDDSSGGPHSISIKS